MIWARKYTPAHLHQDGHAVVFPSLRCRILTRKEYDARRQQDCGGSGTAVRFTTYSTRSIQSAVQTAVGCKPREAVPYRSRL